MNHQEVAVRNAEVVKQIVEEKLSPSAVGRIHQISTGRVFGIMMEWYEHPEQDPFHIDVVKEKYRKGETIRVMNLPIDIQIRTAMNKINLCTFDDVLRYYGENKEVEFNNIRRISERRNREIMDVLEYIKN